MILVGNQRGFASELAQHLLKPENEHVTVHEVSGFIADNLADAFQEAYAISKGTKCRQHLFSLSLNPPTEAKVTTAQFEAAISRVEVDFGLEGQPRAIVFHEKHGRRHCHCVWSRIDLNEMKAIQLSYSKNKLMDISRQLFIENNWELPQGFIRKEHTDPRNFTLAQWQQAQRQEKDPKAIKAALQEAWAISDNENAFANALDERGYKLARGDRRGFVAIDMQGEVYSVPKWVGIKTKAVRAKLGDEDDLNSVEQTLAVISDELKQVKNRLKSELLYKTANQNKHSKRQLAKLREKHTHERQQLLEKQNHVNEQRQAEWRQKFNGGLRGLWDRVTGKHKRLLRELEVEAWELARQDQLERDNMIFQHLEERRKLKVARSVFAEEFKRIATELDDGYPEHFERLTSLKARGSSRRRKRRSLPT
jgi:hypothetical protein